MPPSDGRRAAAAGIRIRLLEAELRVERRHAVEADARVRELQSHLRDALAQSAESRETAEALQRALSTAEESRAALEVDAARRERQLAELLNARADPAAGVDPQFAMLAETLAERARQLADEREQYATAVRTQRAGAAAGDESPPDASLEARLRMVEATLQKTLEELEERQVAAIELRTVLVATEHRAAAVERDFAERLRQSEIGAEAARAELVRVRQQAEETRVLAAEARTILDATEYRIPQLEEALSTHQRENAALRVELDSARAELQAAHERATLLGNELAGLRSNYEETARARLADQAVLQDARAALGAATLRADQAEAVHAQTLGRMEEVTTALAEAHDHAAAVAEERDAAVARASTLGDALADRERVLAELKVEQSATTTRLSAERAEVEARLVEAEAARREACEAHTALRETAEAEREALAASVSGLERQVRSAGEECNRLAEDRDRLASMNARLEERIRQLVASHASAVERLTASEARSAALATELDSGQKAHAAAQAAIERLRAEGEAGRRTVGELTGEANELRAQLEEERRTVHELRDLQERSTELYAQAEGDLQQAVAGRIAAESRAIEIGAALAEREREINSLRETLAAAEEAAGEQRVRLAAVEQERVALERAREDAGRRLAACADRDELAARAAAQAAELAHVGEQAMQLHAVREELERRQAELQNALRRQSDELTAARDAAHAAQMQAAATSTQLESVEKSAVRACDERDEALHKLAARDEEVRDVRSAYERVQGRVTEVETALSAAEARDVTVQAALAAAKARAEAAETQYTEEAARAAALVGELETQSEARRALESELTEERAQVARLESELEATSSLAEREAETLQARLADTNAEGDRLRQEVASLIEMRDQLRVRAAVADDVDRQRAENARLVARVEEVERQHAEAARQHSDAVTGYMLEVSRRTDELRQREAELASVREELQAVHQACEQAVCELAEMRQEHEALEGRMRELQEVRRAGASPPRRTGGAAMSPASNPSAAVLAKKDRPRAPSGPVTVVHVEDQVALRDLVRSTVDGCPGARYAALEEAAGAETERSLLVVNLLVRDCEVLNFVADTEHVGMAAGSAFVYCVEDQRGIVIGRTELFSPPFDAERYATRLLERPGGTRRVLAVGESISDMNEMRALLNGARCSTSVALDVRQGYDLLPMVKPEVVLIDLGLPRGEGLRLAARLRRDPATANIEVGFLWGRPLEVEEFRLHAARAIRDFQFSSELLTRALQQELSASDSENEELRVAG